MSGNAALAAAKRRRNPAQAGSGTNQSLMQPEMEKPIRKPQSIPQLLVEHDRKIFILEKKVEESDLSSHNTNIGNSVTGDNIAVANNAENMAKSNTIEIKLLKTTVTKQGKALQEAQSLLTTLRATLNTQTAEINRLKSLKDDVDTLKKVKADAIESSDEETEKVELKVSEK